MATLSDLYNHLKTLCEQWFYNKSQIDTSLGGKVDKETGKGLSSNDYTTTEKNKLAGIEAQANKTVVDTALSSTSTNPLQNKAINTALSNKADSSSVPTKTSDLTNDGADGTNVYVSNNDSRLSDSRTPTSHTHGNLTSDGKIGTTANKPLITTTNGVVTTSSFGNSANTFCEGNDSRLSNARTPTLHTHYPEDVVNGDSLFNIISLGDVPDVDNQKHINIAIDRALGNLSQIKALEVVSTLPTASASTMGLLYIINENSKINFYYTEYDEHHDVYDWHKMDTDILDELVVSWDDVRYKPTDFTPSSHTHGQITNDGKITSTAVTVASGDNIVITDASDSSKVKRVANLLASHIKDGTAHSNIGSSANDTQATINTNIDTALSNKISKSTTTGLVKNDGTIDTTTYLSSLPSHTHGNILNGGTCTTDVTFNSKILVTNSSNKIGTSTAIDVLDSVVQSLITYGNS